MHDSGPQKRHLEKYKEEFGGARGQKMCFFEDVIKVIIANFICVCVSNRDTKDRSQLSGMVTMTLLFQNTECAGYDCTRPADSIH